MEFLAGGEHFSFYADLVILFGCLVLVELDFYHFGDGAAEGEGGLGEGIVFGHGVGG